MGGGREVRGPSTVSGEGQARGGEGVPAEMPPEGLGVQQEIRTKCGFWGEDSGGQTGLGITEGCWGAPDPVRPQIFLAGQTGPGGVVGLDDLILSDHCKLVPGEPAGRPTPQPRRSTAPASPPDPCAGPQSRPAPLLDSGPPAPGPSHPACSLGASASPDTSSVGSCVFPRSSCVTSRSSARGARMSRSAVSGRGLTSLQPCPLGAAGKAPGPSMPPALAGTTDFESPSGGGWEDASVGRLQWVRLPAPDWGGPGPDARGAAGEAPPGAAWDLPSSCPFSLGRALSRGPGRNRL